MFQGVLKRRSTVGTAFNLLYNRRNGVFECYKDDSTASDLEFSFTLNDCELQPPAKDSEHPLSLSIQRAGDNIIMIEVRN